MPLLTHPLRLSQLRPLPLHEYQCNGWHWYHLHDSRTIGWINPLPTGHKCHLSREAQYTQCLQRPCTLVLGKGYWYVDVWSLTRIGSRNSGIVVGWSLDERAWRLNKVTKGKKANLRDLIAATGLVIWIQIVNYSTCVTLKFDGWPRKE